MTGFECESRQVKKLQKNLYIIDFKSEKLMRRSR